jgi:hypothetical protein
MKRTMIVLAIAGLLVACTDQGEGSAQPSGSAVGGSPETSGDTSTASAACNEAFAPLAEMEIGSLSDLGDLRAEVEPTIQGCESVADWIAGAQQVVDDDINPNTVALLLNIICADQSLDDTPICDEIASS